jgi:restriction system protein
LSGTHTKSTTFVDTTNCALSTITPVKAGWLTKSKGRWAITESGVAVLEQFRDPERLIRESIACTANGSFVAKGRGGSGSEQREGGVSCSASDAEGGRTKSKHVAKMDPYDFQKLVAALLAAMSYHVAWVTAGPDHGVDIVAYPTPARANLGEGFVVGALPDRRQDVREFISVLHGSDLGSSCP